MGNITITFTDGSLLATEIADLRWDANGDAYIYTEDIVFGSQAHKLEDIVSIQR